jgi:DNA-binding CsgD family transcriptional regulator
LDLVAAHPDRWTGSDDSTLLDAELDGVRCTLKRTSSPGQLHEQLSPREIEITEMLALGLSNKAIAGQLGISTFTVASHLRRIFVKLGCTSRAGAVGLLSQRRVVFDIR